MTGVRILRTLRTPRILVGLAMFSLVTQLAGCGYHLRGSAEAGAVAREIFVDGPAWLKEELEVLVESAGGTILKGPQDAPAIIRYRDDGFDRRVISVDSRTGKEREFELAYSLNFDALDKDGQRVLDNARVQLLRDYIIDADAVLGKGTEEEVLKDEMRRDAVSQLLRRVESAIWR